MTYSPGGSSAPARIHAVGFPRWKKPIVRQCFAGSKVDFLEKGVPVAEDACVAVWGNATAPPGLGPAGQVFRLEDGFLRSVGLGADIVRPLSWVVDPVGIYYDATRPSGLERILGGHPFDPSLLERAGALRERIIAERITKYNVDHLAWQRPSSATRVILVPGQVESDASIALGAPGISRNMELLRAVRESNPGAYVLYKPHPDVVARMRLPGADEGLATRWCDEIITNVEMGMLLSSVDEVHVLTSLAGFEALLRGKPVTCYGQPFYAGWGLTKDLLPPTRRTRRLGLDELLAGVLILYPIYLHPTANKIIQPEEALDLLIAWRARTGGRNPWWHEGYRAVVRKIAGVR